MAQQMPLPLTISCSSKSRLVLTFLVLPFWYLLTHVVPNIFQKSSKTVVCVCVAMSSDKHSSSPRHSHSLQSSASTDAASCPPVSVSSAAGAVTRSLLTSTQPSSSLVSLSHSQSSHALTSTTPTTTEQLEYDAGGSVSAVTFEDRQLWHDSFSILYEFYQTGTFCDVEIHVGSQRINCHRLVLACFSQYFR